MINWEKYITHILKAGDTCFTQYNNSKYPGHDGEKSSINIIK